MNELQSASSAALDGSPVVFVVPGDLHLTDEGLENHRVAHWMVEEVNELVRPDFVQFIGDNVQHATAPQFELFSELCLRLTVRYEVLVGDHDVCDDPRAERFQDYVGKTFGAFSLHRCRFVRLNTLQPPPLGLSAEQLSWFHDELASAAIHDEQVVVFQHHYPFKVFEQYDGPGIDAWRQLIATRPIAAIFSGHTHYGQIANDGRNVYITTRSIGDPEGGPPGYTLAHVEGDDLGVTYRSAEDRGPIALITHPRDLLLARGPKHIVSGPDRLRVATWSSVPLRDVLGRIDGGNWFRLYLKADAIWEHPLDADRLAKGEHALEVIAVDTDGGQGGDRIHVLVDPTGRYTPVPSVRPQVKGTAFC